ncbi:replication/maintenance protein RepL [Bacillus thuringiensis]|uniref:replication/maintenance protein RepL n=1 Tax=Bacillus thuringiensis TaxID=1428 RepID=UPI00345775D4
MPKVSMIETTKIVSPDGEKLEETKTMTFNYGKEPDYIKVYLDNIMFIAEISGWVSKIMYELIKSVTYANKGQFIIVNAGYKRILAENLGIKPQSVTNAINDLVKKGILIRKESGVFLLNPQYFGKGEWKDIAKIRYEVELNSNGKTLRLKEIEKTEEELEEIEA